MGTETASGIGPVTEVVERRHYAAGGLDGGHVPGRQLIRHVGVPELVDATAPEQALALFDVARRHHTPGVGRRPRVPGIRTALRFVEQGEAFVDVQVLLSQGVVDSEFLL